MYFTDEVECIKREAAKLQSKGVNKILALGHAGMETNIRVAQIPGVDVVIAGDRHHLMYTGILSVKTFYQWHTFYDRLQNMR